MRVGGVQACACACLALLVLLQPVALGINLAVKTVDGEPCAIAQFSTFSISRIDVPSTSDDAAEEPTSTELISITEESQLVNITIGACAVGENYASIGFQFYWGDEQLESTRTNMTLYFTGLPPTDVAVTSWYVSQAYLVNASGEYTFFDELYDNEETSPAVAYSGYGYECPEELYFGYDGEAGALLLVFGDLRMQPFNVQSEEVVPAPESLLDTCVEPGPELIISHETAIILASVFGSLIFLSMAAYLVHCFYHGNGNITANYQRLQS